VNQLDKVNENSLHLLLAVALLSLIVFSQSGGIISTYGQLSPGNSNTTTQLDSAQKSPDNGQSIATPGPSENDLGITNEQSKINNKEIREDQPQILQQKQDKEEETSDNSDEVDGDNIPTNSEQDIEEKQGQKGQGDEEVKNNDDSKKENNDDSKKENNDDSKKENNEDSKKENNEDIRLDWMPFP
jgi:hypothetical protein